LVDANHELVMTGFVYRPEVHVAHSTDHGIDFSNAFVHGPNIVDFINITLNITARSANADDLMAIRKGRYCGPADGAAGTYN